MLIERFDERYGHMEYVWIRKEKCVVGWMWFNSNGERMVNSRVSVYDEED